MQSIDSSIHQWIEAFDFSDIGSDETFAERLAIEQGWTLGFALRVEGEYRRFLVLTQVCGGMSCPSDEVDQAWHVHLTLTQNYATFCEGLPNGFLHHYPSKGGAEELARHRKMYSQTLENYRITFGHTAPAELWPAVDVRFSRKRAQAPLETFVQVSPDLLFGMSTLGVLLLTWPLSHLRPIKVFPDTSGPDFLLWFSLAYGLLFLVGFVRLSAPDLPAYLRVSDPLEAAWLGAKERGASLCALAMLVHRGIVKSECSPAARSLINPHGILLEFPECNEGAVIRLQPQLHPVEKRLLEHFRQGGTCAAPLVEDALWSERARIRNRIARCAFLVPDGCITTREIYLLGTAFGLAFVGALRVFAGAAQGRPVWFLTLILLVATIGVYMLIFRRRRLSLAGRTALKLAKESAQFRDHAGNTKTRSDTADFAMSYAVFGTLALMQTPGFQGNMLTLFSEVPRSAAAAGSSSSGSGDGGGGSGCGGGGCGGGCGG